MANVMAAMLDELMGRDRNLAPGDKARGIKWDDKRVCKYYLCGTCPHELFTNTKSDLGPCDKIHDDDLKAEFEKAPPYQRCHVEDEFERMIDSHIRECDKRIARGHQRLKLSREQQEPGSEDERVKNLTEKINELMDKAEQLGCEGRVEEAQGMTRLCEQLKAERQQKANEASGISPIVYSSLKDEKMMEVCEICGVFLIIGDAQSRIDDHLNGKQHIGYAKLRAVLKDRRDARTKLRQDRDKAKAEAEAERLKRREDRDREKSSRRGDRRRSKSRDRDRRSAGGDRRRSRSPRDRSSRSAGERKRSRSRDRSRRDRSRDSKRRSRSRDSKRRSRSRSRGSNKRRSRSRDAKKKSRDSSREKRGGSGDRVKGETNDHQGESKQSTQDKPPRVDSEEEENVDGTSTGRNLIAMSSALEALRAEHS